MITKDKNAIPGDISSFIIKLTPIGGTEKDISRAVSKVLLFQDILAPFWSGSILISDTSNLITTLPIEHGVPISVTWSTEFPDPPNCKGSKTIELIVYGITNRQHINNNLTTYTLLVATKEFIIDKTKRIAEVLPQVEGNPNATEYPEKLIQHIVKNYIDKDYKVNVPKQNTKKAYILESNNWSPLYAISFLSKLALTKGSKSDKVDLLFFKSDNKEFQFQSIEDLYNLPEFETGITLIQKRANYNDPDKVNDPESMTSIIEFSVDHFNSIANLDSGSESNRIISFDFFNSKVNFTDFKRGDDWEEDKAKNKKRSELIDNDETFNSNIMFQPKHSGLGTGVYNEISSDINNSQEMWLAARRAALMKLEENKLKVQLNGSACSWKWLGKTLKVNFPRLTDNKEEQNDPDYSGKYLVTSICHDIDPQRYSINLGMSRIRLGSK